MRVSAFFVAFGAGLGAVVGVIAHALGRDHLVSFGFSGPCVLDTDFGLAAAGPAWMPLMTDCIGVGAVVGVLAAYVWHRSGLHIVRVPRSGSPDKSAVS